MVNIDLINLGTGANTGDGDSLRVGAAKINQNFSNVLEFLESLEEDTNEDRLPNVFHVSIDGIAGNVGTSVADSVPSVKEAVELANAYVTANPGEPALVVVHPGQYTEQNPITVKRNISIYGKGLRVVDLLPQNPLQSYFLVDSGFKAWGLSIIGLQADSVNQAWCFEFNANADNTGVGASGTGAYILKSPYIQNCSSYTAEDDTGQAGSTSTGSSGGGLKVDGNACAPNSPIRSMVVDSFTQVNLGGPGCLVTNDGYAQLVSFFGTFCTYHCKADKGGQVNFTGGTTDFGNYGLVADGYSSTPIYTAKAFRSHYGVRRSELTFENIGVGQLVYVNHGLLENAPVTVKSATNKPLPPGITAGVVYYLVSVSSITVRLSATVNGPVIVLSTESEYTTLITIINQGELSVYCDEFTANRIGTDSRPGNGVLMFPQLTFPRTGSLAADATTKGSVALVEQSGNVYTAVATLDTSPAIVGKHEYVPNTGTVTVTRTGIFVDPQGNTIETVPVAGLNTYTFNVEHIEYNHLTGYTTFTATNYIPSALDEFYFTDCAFICQLSAYVVTSAEPINAFGNVVAEGNPTAVGYKVNLFNATNGGLIYPIAENATLDFRRRSQISAPSHVFEYVGSGINYNALPENGGVPVQANAYQEINNGRVFISWTNEKGDFGVSNRFLVDGTTGEVTISASSFNLSGLNQIGPFSRNGGLSTVGVSIKEASDNINMISSLGVPDSQTVPTQTAIVDYVSQSLSSGIPNGAIVAGTAFYFTGSEPYPSTRIDSTPVVNGDVLWDKAKGKWVYYNGATWYDTVGDGSLINSVAHFVRNTKPIVRVDGSALVVGDRWYKLSDRTEWVWNGTYWLSATVYPISVASVYGNSSSPQVIRSESIPSSNGLLVTGLTSQIAVVNANPTSTNYWTANVSLSGVSVVTLSTQNATAYPHNSTTPNIAIPARASNTTNSTLTATPLGQTSRAWHGMTTLGTDVYASVSLGDIYKQTGGVGNFVALGQTSRSWLSMTTLGTNVYAAVRGGDIYKQTGGVGDFIALSQTSRNWQGMTTLGTDVYACVDGGDIYKQTGGVGNFVALGQTSRSWYAMTTLGTNVYAAVRGGDIYKQTNGTGNFVALGQTSRAWAGMTTLGTDVYASVSLGDIYKQTGGVGDFVALNIGISDWHGMTTLGSSVYLCVRSSDIYVLTSGGVTSIGHSLEVTLNRVGSASLPYAAIALKCQEIHP